MSDDMRSPFAQLYYTWDELDALAALVDNQIAGADPIEQPDMAMLNSLRTSLREAQQSVRRSP